MKLDPTASQALSLQMQLRRNSYEKPRKMRTKKIAFFHISAYYECAGD
jgi:hypothetical protein